ncbi:hypothetical protein C0J52_26642 [Blattella germanica]|nr:hypothetical protein C0J52_26642 [Blattella germanica]
MFTSNQLLELTAQIMGAFQETFNKAPPLLDWETRAFALAVSKTGRGVEGRRHEKKHVLESLL